MISAAISTQPIRLADTAASEPFFANSTIIQRGGRHRRQDYLDIIAVAAGEGAHITYDGNHPHPRRLTRGTMALYRPGDEVVFTGRPPGGMEILYVSFLASDWQNFAGIVGIDPTWITSREPVVTTVDPDDPGFLAPFNRALQRFNDAPTAFDLVRFWLDVVPALLPRGNQAREASGAPDWIVDAVETMRGSEPDLRAGLPRLLELARVSATHLAATTRRYYERTPTDVVTDLRLRHAAFLLSTSPDSIGEIAHRCGFADAAYFSNQFRRRHLISPREYRSRSLGRGSAVFERGLL
jgi:AraC-like DNA-binding protein